MWTPSYDYLEHHGIEGQKWGRRNGPPYPLDYDDHSTSEKKKNPKSKLDNYDTSKRNKKPSKIKEFAKNHKEELIIGGWTAAAIVGTVLAGRKFAEVSREHKLSDYSIANRLRNNNFEETFSEVYTFDQERHFKNGAKVEGHYVGNKEGYDKAVKDFAERSRRIQNMNYSDIAGLLPMKD